MEFNLSKINWRFWQNNQGQRELISPERDWRLMCVLATLATMAIFVLYFWAGRAVNSLENNLETQETDSSAKLFTREEIAKHAESLQLKQAELERLMSGESN